MPGFLSKFAAMVKKYPLSSLFILILLVSFVWQLNWRNQHFQECDSAVPFDVLTNYPGSTWSYINNFNLPGKILSPTKAARLLNTKFGKKIGQIFWPGQTPADQTAKLAATNPVYLWHNLLFGKITSWRLPYAVQSGFALALGSTYSFAQGFFYGLVNQPHAAFEAFMSNGLVLTVLLFHLSVLVMFFTFLALGLDELPSALASVWALFAISQYEQGFSLGSPVWYTFSAALWLYFCLKYYRRPKFLLIISLVTAVVAWVNYLIVVYWLALMLAVGFQYFGKSGFWKNLWKLLWSQWLAILMIFLSTALFFVPGQGKRGNIMFSSFWMDIYYLFGNFFTWYLHVTWLAVLQFLLGVAAMVIFFHWLYKPSPDQNPALNFFRRLALGFIAALLLFRLTNMLGFAPNRQVLFISPLIFMGAAVALQLTVKKIPVLRRPLAGMFLLLCFAVLGFLAVHARRADVRDVAANIHIGNEVSAVVIRDCSYNLKYKTYNRPVPTFFVEQASFAAGNTYLFLSQTNPALPDISSQKPAGSLTYRLLSQSAVETNAYFMAFTPGMNRFPWTRPNNLYEAEFKVISAAVKTP